MVTQRWVTGVENGMMGENQEAALQGTKGGKENTNS